MPETIVGGPVICPSCGKAYNCATETHFCLSVVALLAAKDAEITQLRSENDQWRTWGVVEIAVRNPNVASYMEHWEGRATKAEAENAALREKVAALEKQLDAANLGWA